MSIEIGIEQVPLDEVSVLYTYQKGDSVKTGCFLSIEDVILKAMNHLTYLEATPIKVTVAGIEWSGDNIQQIWRDHYITQGWDQAFNQLRETPWFQKAIELGLSTGVDDNVRRNTL